jgi:hypothetical protein
MIRLVDLHPEWIMDGERRAGARWLCPCCATFTVGVLFVNPIGGGPPLSPDHRREHDHAGFRWTRSGDTFETLSISPVILATKAHHWVGHVSSGEVSP